MGFLDPYRVLDLTDEHGLLAGRILADLGADVVQVEPPGGSSARRVGPFTADGESLFWAAYAANKRGLTCDVTSAEDRARLLDLCRTADFVIDSAPPGALAEVGLAYEDLRRENPAIIHVSITPFGSTGPKAAWAESDLVVWAASGALYPNQEGDLPPLRISTPQAYLHAAADAAAGALAAHAERLRSGLGQHVEVSAQISSAQATLSMILAAAVSDTVDLMSPFVLGPSKGTATRRLDLSGSGSRTRRSKWRLRDGLAELHLAMGPAAGGQTNALFAWIGELEPLDDELAQLDWRAIPEELAARRLRPDTLERARAVVAAFLVQRTKEEVMAEAIRRKLAIGPVYTVVDLIDSAQLAQREFWCETLVEGRAARLPGVFAASSVPAFTFRRCAPERGEAGNAHWESAGRAHTPARPPASRVAPFHGLCIVDLSWVVAGPTIARALADLGATVVRVESSRRLDLARLVGPHADGDELPESSACYSNVNAGKRGIALDLSSDGGQEVVRDLIAWGSVLIESFSPGVMARWGLGYDALAAEHPGLIMLSTSLMGQTGPCAAFAGSGNVGAALAGFQSLAGWPGRLPFGPYGPYTDYVGPRFALIALLAALDHRHRTGLGTYLDVAQTEAAIHFLGPEILDAQITGRVAAPLGNADLAMAPHGVYPCLPERRGASAWIAIAVTSDRAWQGLAGLIGGNAGLSTGERLEYASELDAQVTAWTSSLPAEAIEAQLQERGVPSHRVASPEDALRDPQLGHEGHFREVPHPRRGRTVVEGPRFRLADTPAQIHRAGPVIGEDTSLVLRDILGYSESRIATLHAEGVLR